MGKGPRIGLALAAAALLAAAYRHWKSLKEDVVLIHHATHSVVENWKRKSKAFREGYRPTLWFTLGTKFFSGSLHTLGHNVAREMKQHKPKYKRELIKLSDSGTVALDWALSVECGDTGRVIESPDIADESYPVVFIHHGICGSSTSHYVRSIVRKLLETGKFRVVVMVARGCGGLSLSTPDGFNASRTLDIRECLENHIHARHPNSPVYAIGYSLGAGILGKYMGEEGEMCRLDGACLVSPSFDYNKKTPFWDFWSRYFLSKLLITYSKTHLHVLKKNDKIDLENSLRARTVAEYDHSTIVRNHGYRDTEHYYADASPNSLQHRIMVPTLALLAHDDPLCSIEGAPSSLEDGLGKGLVIAKTSRGGHVSWAEGLGGHSSWMDRAVVDWLLVAHERVEALPKPRPHWMN